MTLEELAIKTIEAAEELGVDFMAVGAIPAGAYGIPRSTRDVLANLRSFPASGRQQGGAWSANGKA